MDTDEYELVDLSNSTSKGNVCGNVHHFYNMRNKEFHTLCHHPQYEWGSMLNFIQSFYPLVWLWFMDEFSQNHMVLKDTLTDNSMTIVFLTYPVITHKYLTADLREKIIHYRTKIAREDERWWLTKVVWENVAVTAVFHWKPCRLNKYIICKLPQTFLITKRVV